MSEMSIEVNTCSATLYNGTAAVGACAGNSFSIEKWIIEQQKPMVDAEFLVGIALLL